MLGLKPVEIKEKGKQEVRKEQEKEYLKKKKAYLAIHKTCEVEDCKKAATDLHHKKTRIGNMLTDEKYFMAVCRKCHTKITTNSKWAIQQGYSISKFSK